MSFDNDLHRFVKLMRKPSSVPRRDAYLFTWGVGYIALAIAWLICGYFWGVIFIIVGLMTVISSISKSAGMKSVSFALLSGVATLHALNFIWPFPFLVVSMPKQMIVLWIVVALGHVVVAGWPTHCLQHANGYDEHTYDQI